MQKPIGIVIVALSLCSAFIVGSNLNKAIELDHFINQEMKDIQADASTKFGFVSVLDAVAYNAEQFTLHLVQQKEHEDEGELAVTLACAAFGAFLYLSDRRVITHG